MKNYQQQQSTPNLHSNQRFDSDHQSIQSEKYGSPTYPSYQKNMSQQQLYPMQQQQQPSLQQQVSPFPYNYNEPRQQEDFQPAPKQMNSLRDVIRIYVTLKKTSDSNVEYKKLILMTPSTSIHNFQELSKFFFTK